MIFKKDFWRKEKKKDQGGLPEKDSLPDNEIFLNMILDLKMEQKKKSESENVITLLI